MTKTTIALAAALLLGVASAAYAGSRNDNGRGGARVGPIGNVFQTGANPARPFLTPAGRAYSYAYQARGKRNRSR